MELTTSFQKVAETSYKVTGNVTGYLRLYLKYGNRNINNNQDTIYYEIRQQAVNPYGNYLGWQWDTALDWSIKNGSNVLANGNYKQSAIYSDGKEVVRASGSFVQKHNDDGNWSSTLTLTGYIYTYSVQATGSVSLPMIPRASSISVANADIDSNTTITISRKSSSFTHTLTYKFGNLTGTIATKTSDTSITWKIPTSFYNQIPNAKSGTLTVTCTTYNGNTQVGTSTTDTCTITVSENLSQPVLTSGYSLKVSDSVSAALTGATNKIINGYSTVEAYLPITVKNSATLSEYKVVNANTSKTSKFTNSFSKVINKVFDIYAKDSRGFTLSGKYPYSLSSLTMLDYFQPAIKTLNIRRTEQTSKEIILSLIGTYWNKTFGSVTNVGSIMYSYRYKLSSSSTWNSWVDWKTPTINGSNISITDLSLGSNFDTEKAYDFQVRIKDALGNSDSNMIVVSAIQQVTKSTPVVEIADDYVAIMGNLILNETIIYSCTVLFNGESNDTITLNDSVSNYEYIEIFYKTNDNAYSSVKVYSPNNKTACLIGAWLNNSTPRAYFKIKAIKISDSTISNYSNTSYGELANNTSGTYNTISDSNNIYITRVVGYK